MAYVKFYLLRQRLLHALRKYFSMFQDWAKSENPSYPALRLRKTNTAQKIKLSIKEYLSRFDQIGSFLRTCSHSLKYFLRESIFCAA